MDLNDDLLFAWAEFMTIQKGQSPVTVHRYQQVVQSLFTWLAKTGHPATADSITRDSIGEWMKALFYDFGNVSNRSRASKLSAIRSFFGWMKYTRRLNEDPSQGIPSPKVQESLPQKFSTDDLRKLFAAPARDTVRGLRDLAMLKTMYAAGPRVSELVRLDMNHIIDTSGYIRLQIIDGKGGKSRTVTMRSNPSKALREWLLIRKSIESDTNAVFIRLKKGASRAKDERLSDKSAQNILKKYARAVGIAETEVFVHKMRATFATDLYDSGNDQCPHCRRPINYVGIMEVALLLGHESLDTVMRYVGISERVLRKTAIPDKRFQEIEACL